MTTRPESTTDNGAEEQPSGAVPTGEQPAADTAAVVANPDVEIGGRDGPDPTRFGDWEKNGRCIDF